MTYEVYPNLGDFNLVENLVYAYINFIDNLKAVRKSKLDNEMLLSVIDLFYTVKTDSETIGELKKMLSELNELSKEKKNAI